MKKMFILQLLLWFISIPDLAAKGGKKKKEARIRFFFSLFFFIHLFIFCLHVFLFDTQRPSTTIIWITLSINTIMFYTQRKSILHKKILSKAWAILTKINSGHLCGSDRVHDCDAFTMATTELDNHTTSREWWSLVWSFLPRILSFM